MSVGSSALRVLVAALCAALLAACSSEDAQQAATAAGSLRNASEVAISSFAALQARSRKEPASWNSRLATPAIVEDEIRQAGNAAGYNALTPNERVKQLRARLTPVDAALEPVSLKVLDGVLARARLMEASAIAYAKAWPLGTEQLACMREHALAYGKGMREAALLLNAGDPAGPLYQRFDNELAELAVALKQAVVENNKLAAAEAVERMKALILEERRENAKVQMAFARSAEAAATVVDAIDKAGTVNLADLLGSVQSLLPRLGSLAAPGEVDAAITRLGALAGRIDGDTWLTGLAQRPLGTVHCPTP